MALSTDHKGNYIAANDSAGLTLTSIERQDNLLAMGFTFEAVVAQAAFIEAFALFYISAVRGRLPKKDLITFERRSRNNSLTFGSMAKLISDNMLLGSNVISNINQYVQARNAIAHSLIASSTLIDLKEA